MEEIDLSSTSVVKQRHINRRNSDSSSEDHLDNIPLDNKNEGAGVTYAWKNLNVYASKGISLFGKKKENEVHILKDVSGLCRGGQLLAIMGASGAGKTTLLNILTYRASSLKLTGDITINGRPADPLTIAGVSAYVQQLDLFTGVFTVREQLNFCAQLRIGKGVSAADRERRVEEVLQELGLMKCANTFIGVPGRIKGISGGEKKRLAFACELITSPMMLLCDEPTSGLDSFMAQTVMAAMKKLTQSGKTVISTIHQPSSEVFSMFDRLLILAEGRVAFLGNVKEAHVFFKRLEKPCPSNFNPGDHFIYTLAVRAGKEDESRKYVNSVCDNFRDHEGKKLDREVDLASEPPKSGDVLATIKLSKDPYRATWIDQFMAMSRRSTYEIIRDPLVSVIKISTSVFFALIFGTIFFQLNPHEQVGVQDISGCLFIFVTNITFSNMFPVITVFSAAMPLFLREHWNGLYRTDVYFLTRNLVELPIYVILPAVFVGVSYYMVGLRPEFTYFINHMLIIILVANVAVSYGYMISCMAKDYNNALVLSTPLLFPIFLFGGFYIQADTIPAWLSWISYLSWFKYGFEDLSIIQWNNFEINCYNATVFFNETESSTEIECITGNDVLDRSSFDPDMYYANIGALVGLLIGFRVLAFLFLLLKTYRK